MPMPKPKAREEQEEFIERFMENPLMKEEYPEEEQRLAIAAKQWEDVCGKERKSGKKKKNDSVQRYDYLSLKPEEEGYGIVSRMKKTDEGYLVGRANLTNVGVFTYNLADGTTRRELRPPEEVFQEESLASLRHKPLTNNHPTEAVTPENIKDYQVGHIGDVFRDEYHIIGDITVSAQEAIEDVTDGKRGLSCGYEATLDYTPGRWLGVEYDAIQRDIRYNHCSIVDEGRAGDSAKIHMDSSGSAGYSVHQDQQEEATMPNLKIVKLDGVEYQAEPDVIKAMNREKVRADEATTKLDALQSEKDTLEAERDSFKERVDALEADLKKAKEDAIDPKRIDEAVAHRLAVLDSARIAGVEVKDEMEEGEVKKAVILKAFPAAKLDGKSEEYMNARFDAAKEILESQAEADAESRQDSVTAPAPGKEEKKYDSAAARQKMIDRYQKREAK